MARSIGLRSYYPGRDAARLREGAAPASATIGDLPAAEFAETSFRDALEAVDPKQPVALGQRGRSHQVASKAL